MYVRARFLVGCALIAGCSKLVAVDVPDLTGIHSVLIVETSDKEVLTTYAFDVPDRGPAPWPLLNHRGDTQLHLFEYGCTLDRLNLKPGPQTFRKDVQPSFALPPAADMLTLDTAVSGAWSAEAAIPDWLEMTLGTLDVPPTNICAATVAAFDAQPLVLPDDRHGPPRLAIPIDDTSALIGTAIVPAGGVVVPARYYRVDVSGQTSEVTINAPGVKTQGYVGAYRKPDGDIYLISAEGDLVHGSLGGQFAVVTSTPVFSGTPTITRDGRHVRAPADFIHLSGPTTADAPFEIYGESYDPRTFARFDGARWTKLASTIVGRRIFVPATVWLGPQHAIGIGIWDPKIPEETENSLVRYKNGVVGFERLMGDSGLAAIMQHPVLGTVIGRDGDGIDIDSGMGWMQLLTKSRVYFVRTLTPLDDGFMYGASTMFNFGGYEFGQWYPSTGFCPGSTYTEYATMALVRLGNDTIVALTLSDFENPVGVTLLKRTHPPHECSTRGAAKP